MQIRYIAMIAAGLSLLIGCKDQATQVVHYPPESHKNYAPEPIKPSLCDALSESECQWCLQHKNLRDCIYVCPSDKASQQPSNDYSTLLFNLNKTRIEAAGEQEKGDVVIPLHQNNFSQQALPYLRDRSLNFDNYLNNKNEQK